ncbi:MAG: hypothetical protein K1W19_04110 [Lachnospiraceae bacterium]
METVKKSYDELEDEVLELYDLIDTLEYNLKMAKQMLNDNRNIYFTLTEMYLAYHCDEAITRNDIADDFISRSIDEIKETENRLRNKEGES